jgi:DNA ligase 1
MKPLLAHKYKPFRVTYPCYVQPKLNGVRALYQAGRFQSRDEVPFPEALLDHLAQPLLRIFGTSHAPTDGELYVHGWSLQKILGAITPVRKEDSELTKLVEYHIFDVVDFSLPFIKRMRPVFDNLRHDGELIKHVATIHAADEAYANEYYAHWVSLGYEGMVYRLGDCPYTVPHQDGSPLRCGANTRAKKLSDQDNRCWHLLKRKDWQDAEFLIVGVIEGEGRLVGTLGAIVCETEDKKRFHVGSGFTDEERARWWNSWPLTRRAKVKYLCLSADRIPLNPTILAII